MADGPDAFRDYTDSLPQSDALVAMAVPPGMFGYTIAATAPTGWLLVDGSTVVGAQTLYPKLWTVAPTAWKVGADLHLPDARRRIAIGLLATDPALDAIGELGGSSAIALANLPAHDHPVNVTSGTISADHTHGFTTGPESAAHAHGAPGTGQFVTNQAGGGIYAGGIGGSVGPFTGSDLSGHTHGGATGGVSANHTHAVNGTSGQVGSGAAYLPPYITLNPIVKAT